VLSAFRTPASSLFFSNCARLTMQSAVSLILFNFRRFRIGLIGNHFGFGNGCSSLGEMRSCVSAIRTRIRYNEALGSNEIGCIQLIAPTFFEQEDWSLSLWIGSHGFRRLLRLTPMTGAFCGIVRVLKSVAFTVSNSTTALSQETRNAL
jgi:hypothetical protein